jgi:hypothetical protein
MRQLLPCLCAVALGVAAFSAADDKGPPLKRNTSPGFEALKKLAGEWTGTGPDGKPGTIKFKVTSGGSVLVETMFPDTDHEMITVYHMDGPDLVMTHYCAMGNQPRLKADSAGETKTLSFKSVGGTNMKLDDMHMGRAKFTLVDDDHYTVEWCSCNGGKPVEAHRFTVKLTRKK